MNEPSRKDELERRLEQSRRLSRLANDRTTKERIDKLTDDLEAEQQQQQKQGDES
jgi:hypothetical protein